MRFSVEAEPTELADLLTALMGHRAPAPVAAAHHPVHAEQIAAPAPVALESGADLRTMVKDLVYGEMHHVLTDVEFRVAQAYDVERRSGQEHTPATAHAGKVYAEDLHIGKHQITGYTITANNNGTGTAAGYIAWASLHIVYNGTDYAITNGNTNLKYAWFDPAVSTTLLQVSNTRPDLIGKPNACLVFVNNGGTPVSSLESDMPVAVATGAVDSLAIQSKAITQGLLADKAVGTGQIADQAVGSTQIGSKAVATANIADQAITNTQIGSKAVNTGQIADNAVGTTQIGLKAVTTGTLADAAVTSTQLGSAAVTATKLNVLSHMLY